MIPGVPSTFRYDELLGLPYVHGVTDCYQLVRRFYQINWKIKLRNYAYPVEWWANNPELDLYMKHFADEGFEQINAEHQRHLEPGYVLLIARGMNLVNHSGVYLGGGFFLHHPFREESRVDRWAGPWMARTRAVVRHPGATPPADTSRIDLMDLLPEHKRSRYRELLATRPARPVR